MPNTAVSVLLTATLLLQEAYPRNTPAASRKEVTIFNNSTANYIFIERKSELTTLNQGLPVAPQTGWKWTKDKGDDTDSPYFGIASVAGVDTRVEWA